MKRFRAVACYPDAECYVVGTARVIANHREQIRCLIAQSLDGRDVELGRAGWRLDQPEHDFGPRLAWLNTPLPSDWVIPDAMKPVRDGDLPNGINDL